MYRATMKRTVVKRASTAGLWLLALTLMGSESSCDPDLLGNPGFDLWCGDDICGWDVEAGEVERVSTWHERDFAAALVGDEVILSQLGDFTHDDADCLVFELLADVGEDAWLTVELDFLDDGIVEFSEPIVPESWEPIYLRTVPPEWYRDARVRLYKEGSGEVQVAQIRLRQEEDERWCEEEPLALTNRPEGAPCTESEECESGSCEQSGTTGVCL